MPSRLVFAWVTLLVLVAGCRIHALEDGTYVLTGQGQNVDTCGMLPSAPALGQAGLSTQGDLVQMTYDALAPITMSGEYPAGVEQFYLDGTAQNVTVQVRGVPCQLDMFAVHLVGTADSSTAFHGQIGFDSQALNADACACQMTFGFTAVRQ